MKKNQKKCFSAEEIKDAIWKGKRDFRGITINGDLIIEGKTIKGSLFLYGVTIEGQLFIQKTTIDGTLQLTGATIKGQVSLLASTIKGELGLSRAKIYGSLSLTKATIDEAILLRGVYVEGGIDFSFKAGPIYIRVSSEMAELIHWSAPTTPLNVVIERRQYFPPPFFRAHNKVVSWKKDSSLK